MTTINRRTMLFATAWLTARVAYAEEKSNLKWLAEVQQPPEKLPIDAQKLRPLLRDDADNIIATLEAWQRRRKQLRDQWLDFLGALPAKSDELPTLKVLAEDRVEEVIRQRVEYEVEPGEKTEAYLLRPAAPAKDKRPGVVVFHSTVDVSIDQPAGVAGEPTKAFGLQLAKQGFVTFCPRNYLWPENHRLSAKEEAARFLKREPKCKGMTKMLFDGQVALDILGAQADVDAKRLGAVGHSLGGKEVLYLAAFDERVKATVSSEGGVGIGFSNWNDAWYLGDAVKKPDFKLEHHELLALIAPRPFLLIGGDSADGDRSWPFIDAVRPVYKLYGEPIKIGLYNHKQGHSMPEEAMKRTGEWCTAWL